MTAITGGEVEVKTKDEKAFGPYKGYNDDDKKQARPPFDTNSGREESHSVVTYLNISCANSWRLRRQVCHSWAVSGET